MTAAMAFFSIALTLNLTGVRLSNLRWADFRPASIRAYMERRLTTASVPIVRYYDHLRFVYEVESRMRELRRTEGEGQDGDNGDTKQNNGSPAAPGESKQPPVHKDGGSRVDPPQQSGKPEMAPAQNDIREFLDASLKLDRTTRAFRPLQTSKTGREIEERGKLWTA
jgi:hypothetical protein